MNRRPVLLLGAVYVLGVAALLAAAAAVTGIWPIGRAPAAPAAAISQGIPTPGGAVVPTLAPIWPAGAASTEPRATRTPTRTATKPPPTRTPTIEPAAAPPT